MEKQNIEQSEITTSSILENRDLIVDIDDFCEDNHKLDLLFKIRGSIPNLKVNVFTILGRCSDPFIAYVKTLDWIDMIPHGWMHRDAYECKAWTLQEAKDYFEKIEKYNLTRGFKAPGWQISDETYIAAQQYGYWVADQDYNDKRRPKAVSVYKLDSPNKKHYHIQDVCSNGIEESKEEILSLKGNNFKFIKEIL